MRDTEKHLKRERQSKNRLIKQKRGNEITTERKIEKYKERERLN